MRDLQVKLIVLVDGERLPVLLDRANGVPLFKPSIYSVSILRSRNLASNTIAQVLRVLMLLYVSTERRGIEIEKRIQTGEFLDLSEIDALAADFRSQFRDVAGAAESDSNRPSGTRSVVSLERHRSRIRPRRLDDAVDMETTAVRLAYARDYLDWMALQHSGKQRYHGEKRIAYDLARRNFRDALSARIPTGGVQKRLPAREGLTTDDLKLLRSVIEPGSPANPWREYHARARNQLIVLFELLLGLRRGEMLGVKISDIDFQKEELLIRRRADDVTDPRADQPNAKTRARLLPLRRELIDLIERYVLGARLKLPGARRHEFLFVAERTGKPMSAAAISKVHQTIRRRIPELPNCASLADNRKKSWPSFVI